MCGIAGLVASEPLRVDPVRRMVESMRHRGPDDSGVHAPVPTTVLGSARLSIIDLSPAGHQPMANEGGSVWIVFNGEVYNFRRLREELEACGHHFRSNTDTEVVLHAYEEWGPDCVGRLRGMFAFAIHDGRASDENGPSGMVLLARDPLGIKPLYYAAGGRALVFASEVRALLASGLLSRELSIAGLASYLLWGSTAEPVTLVEGIRSLPPGHYMLVNARGSSLDARLEEYWQLPGASGGSRDGSRASAIGRLRGLLDDTVNSHLVADVPVGIFLSSGVDSTSVAALAARAHCNVATVTIAFPEDTDRSEAAVARETARRFGTHHHEVPLTGPEMLSRLDEAVAALDQPSMDGINTYFVSWGARQAGLKVALSGLGGDELFGGYKTFSWLPILERVTAIAHHTPSWLRRVAAGAMEGFATGMGVETAYKLADAVGTADGDWSWGGARSYALARAVFVPSRTRRLWNGIPVRGGSEPWIERLERLETLARRQGPFGRVSTLELGTYLVNTLLRDTDSMSMAHSLEVRVPFVDREVAEFVLGLPETWRAAPATCGVRAKGLLLDALSDLLPDDIPSKSKRTFTLPWNQWLRGQLRRRVGEGLADLPVPLRPYLNATAVQAVWQDFLAGRAGWARAWSLFTLNEWIRRYLVG